MAIIRKDSLELYKYLSEFLTLENPVQQLVELARRYANWGVAHPNHYRLMFMPPPEWVEQDRELRETAPIPLEQHLLSVLNFLVTDAVGRGLLKEKYTEPALVAATLWAGLNGVILLELAMKAEDRALIGMAEAPFEARFDTLKEVFLDGFLKERAKP
jgi:hypothetical protein